MRSAVNDPNEYAGRAPGYRLEGERWELLQSLPQVVDRPSSLGDGGLPSRSSSRRAAQPRRRRGEVVVAVGPAFADSIRARSPISTTATCSTRSARASGTEAASRASSACAASRTSRSSRTTARALRLGRRDRPPVEGDGGDPPRRPPAARQPRALRHVAALHARVVSRDGAQRGRLRARQARRARCRRSSTTSRARSSSSGRRCCTPARRRRSSRRGARRARAGLRARLTMHPGRGARRRRSRTRRGRTASRTRTRFVESRHGERDTRVYRPRWTGRPAPAYAENESNAGDGANWLPQLASRLPLAVRSRWPGRTCDGYPCLGRPQLAEVRRHGRRIADHGPPRGGRGSSSRRCSDVAARRPSPERRQRLLRAVVARRRTRRSIGSLGRVTRHSRAPQPRRGVHDEAERPSNGRRRW